LNKTYIGDGEMNSPLEISGLGHKCDKQTALR